MSARRTAPVLLAAALAALPPLRARASEADAFENKIEPISGQLYRKSGRLELEPLFALSLNDAFYSKYFGGVRLGYHLSDFWSLALTGQAGASSPTSSTTLCTASQGCRNATSEQLWQVPGDIKWLAGAEVLFSPVYGKVNVLSSAVLHLDFSLIAGVDWIQSQKALSASQAASVAASGGSPGEAGAPGVHVGLGTHVFFASFAALTVELKDYLYFADVGNLASKELQNQIFLELGVSFFIGGSGR
ncbi:MAG TPA: outer membrane beta-barrel domain-containing protein [Anaeromyxobacteraceae bacterium]|nr:outer membrane beta-barrel domain-containing protein [Anaeromyxobacteraceae bacterium]